MAAMPTQSVSLRVETRQWSFQPGLCVCGDLRTMGCAVRWAHLVVLGVVCFCLSAAVGNEFCKTGASNDSWRCSGGCRFGFGGQKPTVCNKDVLKRGLRKCEEPSDLKNKNGTTYQEPEKCTRCKQGWSGDFCTRRNIAYKVEQNFTDENFTTCERLTKKTTTVLNLNISRGNAFVVVIHLKQVNGSQLEQAKTVLNNCSIEGCNETIWVSDSELKMKCPMSPSRKRKKLIIMCTQEKSISICDIRVYRCNKFWWNVENGCNKFCNCQDGATCDAITGKCPSGKEIQTTTTSGTTTEVSSSMSSVTSAPPSTSMTPTVPTSGPELSTASSLPSTSSDVGTSDGHSPSQMTISKSTPDPGLDITTTLDSNGTDQPATTQASVPSSSTDRKSTGIMTHLPDMKTSPSVLSSTTAKKEEHVTTTRPGTPKTPRPPQITTVATSKTPTSTLTKSSVTAEDKESEKEEDKKMVTSTVRTLPANSDGRKDDDEGGSSGSMIELMAIAGAITALVLVAAVAGILYKKKMRQRETKAGENDDTACVLDMEMDNRTPPSKEDEEVDEGVDSSEPFVVTTEPIAVEDFTSHLCHMKRCGGYSKEFQELPRGIQDTVTAAMEADDDSVRKNRFKDISPYDENRVVLKKEQESDSDYINASYVAGFSEALAYISAQGPLPDTVGDFWHMVWTEGCSKVVMLTNLCEGSKIKCEQYWPDVEGTSQTFGAYVVTCVKVVKRAHFIHRHLRIAKQSAEQDADSQAGREIQHLHFTAWPDHGVPCPVALVRFWSYVVMQPVLLGGPMVVHCSAGIGRTGTFIALDMLTHQAETTGKVSVFPTVRRLRKQRVNMVQTLSQYRFLHEVVQEWLSCRDGDLVRSDLQHGARWKGEEGESATQLPSDVREQCAQQFKMLDELRPTLRSEDTTTAEEKENVDKNRFPDILPVESFRVCLAKLKDDDSDYINAVFLPSLRQQEGYVVTQLPLDSTVADFWHMVRDWNITTVVRFMDASQDQAVSLYPDRGQTVQHRTVNITTTDTTVITPGLSCYTLSLEETQLEKPQSRDVSVYCVDSQQALKLTGTKVFLSLADILLPLVKVTDQPPVVLQCFNGVGPSCILCAVLMGIELLQEEERTSPFLLARLVHTTRPHAFSTCEQYEFMVRCLWHHTRGITEEGEADTTTEKADATTEKADATNGKADATTDNGQEKPASDTTDHVYANT